MKKIFLIYFLLSQHISFGQTSFPSTDIWLMRINTINGTLSFSDPENITKRKGYENQPYFSKDGKTLYYTAQVDSSSTTAIFGYELSTQKSQQVLFSPNSLYSPMPSPSGNGISVVMLGGNSFQFLWHFPMDKKDPYIVFPKRDSIGYYSWVNETSALVYLLGGKMSPNRLSLIHTDGTEKKISENVGRGMLSLGKEALYVQKKDTSFYLALTDFIYSKQLSKTPGRSVDFSVCKDYVLMASGSILYGAKIKKQKGRVIHVEEFKPLQDLSLYKIKGITRMAVSPDGTTLAMAADG
jgi:hypothetical protein